MLARTWFRCSVREMLERVDSHELAEMQALYLIEPWGEFRADVRNAMNCAVTARAAGNDVQPADYMPRFVEQEQSPEEMREILRRSIAAANKG